MNDPAENRITAIERDLIVLQTTLWGASGQNGVAGDVKAVKRALDEYIEEEQERRAAESRAIVQAEREDLIQKRAARRWGLGIGVTLFISAATFVLTIVQGP